jgi:hypothetical protein
MSVEIAVSLFQLKIFSNYTEQDHYLPKMKFFIIVNYALRNVKQNNDELSITHDKRRSFN